MSRNDPIRLARRENKLAAVLEEMTLASSRNDTRGNDPDCCSVSWSWIIRFYNNLAPLPFSAHNPIPFAGERFHN